MDKDSSWYTFKDAVPLAPLKIIAMENCYDFASKVDRYIVNDRQEASKNLRDDVEVRQRHYNEDTFL
ncbi:MAG: ribose-phosphate pyrophosphokinase, partial [Lachnospiraceae bacterium]|nr:ribose-phosphate pyrophosphokinase [Lachnospiraceae bacterium]